MARFLRSYGISKLGKGVVEPRLLGSDSRLRVKVILAGRNRQDLRRTWVESRLGRPIVVFAPAAPTRDQQTIKTTLAGRTRLEDSRRRGRVELPLVVLKPAVELAQPIQTTLVSIRPPQKGARLSPPTTLQVFAGPAVHLARIRPPKTQAELRPPTVVFVPAVEQALRTIKTPFVRIKPPPIRSELRPPTIVRVPAVELDQQTVRTTLARIRPAKTLATLRPPAVVAVPGFIAPPIKVWLARISPAQKSVRLRPPAVLQVFSAARAYLTRIRPAAVRSKLRPPTVVRVPSVELQQQTIRTQFARIRPPQKAAELRPPTVVRVPSVEQQQQTIRRSLARIRPAAIHSVLRPPQALRVFEAAQTFLIRIRPAQTRSELRPPAVVAAAPPAAVEDQIRVTLTSWRPPSIQSAIRAPLLDTQGPQPIQTQIYVTSVAYFRRLYIRAARYRLFPPVVIRVFTAPEITVLLQRIRPRPIRSVLRPPTALKGYAAGKPKLVRIRPPAVHSRLRPPTTLRVFTAPETPLVRIRPPAVHSRLQPPAVVAPARAFPGPSTTTVTIQPPQIRSELRPPIVVAPFRPPEITTVLKWLVRIRPPRVGHSFRVLTPLAFIPPSGKICDDNSTNTADCGTSSTRTRISGTVSSRTKSSGTDQEAN